MRCCGILYCTVYGEAAAHTVVIMATAATHASSEARDVSVTDVVLLLKDTCTKLLKDESLECETDGSALCLKMTQDFLHLLDHAETTKFAAWLCTELSRVIKKSIKAGGKVDREKLWSTFHATRSSDIFVQTWDKFLEDNKMMKEPVFYQELTMGLFEGLVKRLTPLKTSTTTESVLPMTYEEENAVRHIGGYMVRNLSQKFTREKKEDELEALKDLRGDETKEAEESEEWTASIDRGALVYISNAAHQFLCAVEYCMRQHMQVNKTRDMSDTFRQDMSTRILDDDDVRFHWVIVSCGMEDDISERLLESIIYLYITIRGFSFASAILERYKSETKKGTQKAKTLRQSIK